MKKTLILIIFAIVIVFLGVLISNKVKKNTITYETGTQSLSNKKIGWGIKRSSNHEQPDLGKTNQKLIEENNGIAMGNSESKNIYLTFDQGYEAGYTGQILDALKENSVSATFFITAHYLNTESDLVKRMIDEEISSEIMDLHIAIYEKFGYEMKYFRPPMGEYSERTLSVTNSLGYRTVMWSFAYEDWNEDAQPEEKQAKQKIVDNVHNGEIMLLHATSKTNANILSDLIKEIKEMGYQFKSLDEFQK